MNKFKYFPFFFLFFGSVCIIGQKFNFVMRGIPIGGHSWDEIWRNIPILITLTTILAFCTNYFINEVGKNEITDSIEAKKRLEEKEKNRSAPDTHECRVCGCYSDSFPWGADGKSPSYQICPCCGVQFGKEDITLESINEYREKWLGKGGDWFAKEEKPELWNREEQMKNVPNEFI